MLAREQRTNALPPTAHLHDARIARLLGRTNWRCLPAAIRRRFSHCVSTNEWVVFRGVVLVTDLTKTGWLLAQATRLIGGLLPLENQRDQPSVVTVTGEPDGNGQLWARSYPRHSQFPQVIHSAKRFEGPTGLVEQFGAGVGLALTLEAGRDRLIFHGDHFYLHCFGKRRRLPRWLTPFAVTVCHINLADDCFLFDMRVTNRWLGELIRQTSRYWETPDTETAA